MLLDESSLDVDSLITPRLMCSVLSQKLHKFHKFPKSYPD